MKYDIDFLIRRNKRWSAADFIFFWGHEDRERGLTKVCLSQWFPCSFVVNNQYYCCTEQYMMAEKARIFGDEEVLSRILSERNQMTIKKLGKQVRGYDDEVWKGVRYNVVVNGNLAKFLQNPPLGKFLIDTGDRVIVEANPKDSVWGIGLDEANSDAYNPRKWRGTNLLGFALMEVRDILINA